MCTLKLKSPVDTEDSFAKNEALLVDVNNSGEKSATRKLGDQGRKPKLEPFEPALEPIGPERGAPNSLSSAMDNGSSSFQQVATKNPQESHHLPADFLEPLSPERRFPIDITPPTCTLQSPPSANDGAQKRASCISRQFWKAGDYEGDSARHQSRSGGMDHVRVHPKFLHSNATSHKWALGAVAELLDNALDEAANGATFVNVDMMKNPRDNNPMLIIEDDGGGMTPDLMRHCLSFGYSVKSKAANTIGQYGNGFKTSTMRLGADVIVFSCSSGKGSGIPTKSIGMLSYTFLTNTGQEDIIVPMVDYEVQPFGLRKRIRSNVDDWNRNMETIKQWSPYLTEAELVEQFKEMKHQGTRIIVYNLWEDDQGHLELEFGADRRDIQIRGVNREQKKIAMAKRFPNSKHYLTYRHSLRSYASILYLRLPVGFRIILRGKEVEHHSLVNDLMLTQELTYRPHGGAELGQDNSEMRVVVTIGFVKDAREHIDVQGFNVYHKNRLIKPFWRLWNSSGSHGRGVVGVLEANFVEPAHDKQGFERTTVLARLEARLLKMQKTYWFKHCHKVGYYNVYLKKKAKHANKMKSVTRDDWKTKTLLHSLRQNSQKRQQKVACALSGRTQAELEQAARASPIPWVVTRSSRSKRRRIPARAYRTAAASLASTAPNIDAEAPTSRPLTGGDFSVLTDTTNDNALGQSEHVNKLEVLGDHIGLPTENPYTYYRGRTGFGQTDAADVCSNLGRTAAEFPGEVEENAPEDMVMNPEAQLYLFEIERNRQLEAQLGGVKQHFQILQKRMDTVVGERDTVREELEEEQKQGELNDEELRKKLKETLLRVRELEAENRRLQSGRP